MQRREGATRFMTVRSVPEVNESEQKEKERLTTRFNARADIIRISVTIAADYDWSVRRFSRTGRLLIASDVSPRSWLLYERCANLPIIFL